MALKDQMTDETLTLSGWKERRRHTLSIDYGIMLYPPKHPCCEDALLLHAIITSGVAKRSISRQLCSSSSVILLILLKEQLHHAQYIYIYTYIIHIPYILNTKSHLQHVRQRFN